MTARTAQHRGNVSSSSLGDIGSRGGGFGHRANGDFEQSPQIDHAVEAATLAEPFRSGSKRNGNALLAAHVRLKTPGAVELRTRIEDGAALGHLPVVQGLVWRARGIERGGRDRGVRLFDRGRAYYGGSPIWDASARWKRKQC